MNTESKYRPQFGRYMSEAAYQKATKLHALATHPRTRQGDATNAAYALQKLLDREPQPRQQPQLPARQRRPVPGRNTANAWTNHVQSNPNRRAIWQQQSDALHAQSRWKPTAPRPKPRRGHTVPASDINAVYIFLVLLILYILFK
jgi:hypothetical protein